MAQSCRTSPTLQTVPVAEKAVWNIQEKTAGFQMPVSVPSEQERAGKKGLGASKGLREWKEAGERKHWGKDASYCPSWSLSFLTYIKRAKTVSPTSAGFKNRVRTDCEHLWAKQCAELYRWSRQLPYGPLTQSHRGFNRQRPDSPPCIYEPLKPALLCLVPCCCFAQCSLHRVEK